MAHQAYIQNPLYDLIQDLKIFGKMPQIHKQRLLSFWTALYVFINICAQLFQLLFLDEIGTYVCKVFKSC